MTASPHGLTSILNDLDQSRGRYGRPQLKDLLTDQVSLDWTSLPEMFLNNQQIWLNFQSTRDHLPQEPKITNLAPSS